MGKYSENFYLCKKNAMNQLQTDEKFMRLALNEAQKALKQQEVPIGAVVVAGGAVIGRGHNLVETLADPTAHAEMQALTAAAATLGGKYLQECTLYVTVEPCIMCAGAAGWAQAPARIITRTIAWWNLNTIVPKMPTVCLRSPNRWQNT